MTTTMKTEEIRNALDRLGSMEVTTARGRAQIYGREVEIGPDKYVKEDAERERADGYIQMAWELKARTEAHWPGIGDEELEKVEFIREQLLLMAKKAFENVIAKG